MANEPSIKTVQASINAITGMFTTSQEVLNATYVDVHRIAETVCNGLVSEFIRENKQSGFRRLKREKLEDLTQADFNKRLFKGLDKIEKSARGLRDGISTVCGLLGTISNQLNGKKGGLLGGGGNAKDAEKKESWLSKQKGKMSKLAEQMSDMAEIASKFKNISFKDITMALLKSEYVQALLTNYKTFISKWKKKDIENLTGLTKELPMIITNLGKVSLKMKLISDNMIDKLEDLFFGKKRNGGLFKISDELIKRKKTIKDSGKQIRALAGNTAMLNLVVLALTPMSITGGPAALGTWFLSKVVLGFGKGKKGGLVEIFERISDSKKKITSAVGAVAVMVPMSILLTLTGAMLSPMAILGPFAVAGVWFLNKIFLGWGKKGTGGLIDLLDRVGNKSKEIAKGTGALIVLAGGMLVAGSLAALTLKMFSGASLGSLAIMTATIGAEMGLLWLMGKLFKSPVDVLKGSGAIAVMGLSFIVVGYSMKLMYDAIGEPDWKKFGFMMATVGGEIAITSLLALIISTGIGALYFAGVAGVAATGVGFVVLGYSMKLMYNAIEEPDWKKFAFVMANAGAMILVTSLAGLMSPLIGLGSLAMLPMSGAWVVAGFALKSIYETVGEPEWEKLLFVAANVGAMALVTAITGVASPFIYLGVPAIMAMSGAWVLVGKCMNLMYTSMGDVVDWEKLGFMAATVGSMIAITSAAGFDVFIWPGSGALAAMGAAWVELGKAIHDIMTVSGSGTKGVDFMAYAVDKMISVTRSAGGLFATPEILAGCEALSPMANTWNHIGGVVTDMMSHLEYSEDNYAKMKFVTFAVSEMVFTTAVGRFLSEEGLEGLKKMTESDVWVNIGKSIKSLLSSIEYDSDGFKKFWLMEWGLHSMIRVVGYSAWWNIEEGSKNLKLIAKSMTDISKMLKLYSDDIVRNATNARIVISGLFHEIGGRWYYSYFAERKIEHTERLIKALSSPGLRSNYGVIRSIGTLTKDINHLDITKADKLMDLFEALSNIGGSWWTRYDDRVQEILKSCTELVTAIRDNTSAVGSSSGTTIINGSNEGGAKADNITKDDATSVKISNIQELASLIAEEINGSLSVDTENTINLRINGEGGNEWRISRM